MIQQLGSGVIVVRVFISYYYYFIVKFPQTLVKIRPKIRQNSTKNWLKLYTKLVKIEPEIRKKIDKISLKNWSKFDQKFVKIEPKLVKIEPEIGKNLIRIPSKIGPNSTKNWLKIQLKFHRKWSFIYPKTSSIFLPKWILKTREKFNQLAPPALLIANSSSWNVGVKKKNKNRIRS